MDVVIVMMKRIVLFLSCCFFLLPVYAQIDDSGTSSKVRKNTFKTTVLSYLTGSAKLTYERAAFCGQSFEVTVGIIGVGGDAKHNNPHGVTSRLAYKWIFPFSYMNDNPLNGFYVKPEFIYSSYLHEHFVKGSMVESGIHRSALVACAGYQYVFGWFVFDFYVGAGGAFGDHCPDNYYHGFVGLNGESDLAFTFGLKFGFAI